MLSKVCSYSIFGLDAFKITIEVHTFSGLPAINIVGLPDSAVKESKERVRSAIKNSGYKFPGGRITINLSPADIKKEGPSFDLAIAIGILAASKQIVVPNLKDFVILGELSLDGNIQPIKGAIAISSSLSKKEYNGIVLPCKNAFEASFNEDIPVYPVKDLCEVVYFLQNQEGLKPFCVDKASFYKNVNKYDFDFSDVKGQTYVKRGLEIVAAGGHNVLLIGPPGSGKTMLAKRLLTILPDMTIDEARETTKIHSVTGMFLFGKGIIDKRPFRSPHHTSSDVALVGGGTMPKPGEVTLAHNGILFLDELPEFNRNVLEALRQPLEDNYVTISRATQTIRFPSRFMLACTMNPCPCGWFGDSSRECHCSPNQIHKYISKISGPLLDRIDIHLEVPSLKSSELLYRSADGETSSEIKERTVTARKIQRNRFMNTTIFSNATMDHKSIRKYCSLNNDSLDLLKKAIDELGLSARAYDRVLKVARTIADLSGADNIGSEHVAEAVQYRSLDRNWWG